MTTLVENPVERLRVSIDPEAELITVEDTRIGYVSWKIEAMQGEFPVDLSTGLFYDDKARAVSRLPEWSDGRGWWEIKTSGLGISAVVVSVDPGSTTGKMYFLSAGNSPLEVAP